jgi:hypothetical protein
MINVLIRAKLYTIDELKANLPMLYRQVIREYGTLLERELELDVQELHSWLDQQGLLFTEVGEGFYRDSLTEFKYTDADETYTHVA